MLEGGEHAGSSDDAGGGGEGGRPSFQRKKQKMWGQG